MCEKKEQHPKPDSWVLLVKSCRQEQLHLTGSTDVFWSSLEASMATFKDVMKIERTIVVHVVNVL